MSAPLVLIALFWIVGLLIGERLPIPWSLWLLWSLVVLGVGWVVRQRYPPKGVLAYHWPVYGTLLILAFLCGASRAAVAQPAVPQDHVAGAG